ncbi:MAG: molybdopterin-dependent oxidoreductase [Oscillospiraceae bacterium]|nr:molybdopterin-dependent oxidoreductase [Oscillospiraceae bacterium]
MALQLKERISSMDQLIGTNDKRMDFKWVGKPNVPGKLSYALATGTAKFGSDYVVPNMCEARFLRSPHANAKLLSVDLEAGLAVPGVIDIITWEDEELKKIGAQPFGPPGRPYLDEYAEQDTAEVGVIVVAENEDICELALKALDPQWEVLPFIVDIEKGRDTEHPVIRQLNYTKMDMFGPQPAKPKAANVSYADTIQGDVDAVFAKTDADHIFEYTVELPAFASHIPNQVGSIAWWFDDPYHPEGPALHVEGAVQRRTSVGQMYGVPDERTVQEGLFQGGKYCDWGMRKAQEITPFLAKRVGRPVRCVDTREETFGFLMNQRHMSIKVAFDDRGVITAVDDYSVADGGTFSNSSFGTANDQGYGPYYTLRCLDIRQRMEIIDTNRGMMYLSGQHCPFNWDSVTVALHIIADKLNTDVIEIAKRNLHGPESQEDPNEVLSFEACIEAGKEMMDWDWHATGAKTLPDGRKHGAAFRYQMCPRHAFSGYESKLEYKGGKVHLPTQGPCTGIFAVECNALVVAEEVGVDYDDVVIDFDYRHTFTPVGGGSDGSSASSWATKENAVLLKNMILKQAVEEAENPPAGGMFSFGPPTPNPLKGYKPEDLDLVDGKIVVKADPQISHPLGLAVKKTLVSTFEGRPPAAIWGHMGKKFDTMNTVYAEVAVDEETGIVEVTKYGTAIDPGKVLRSTSLESQLDQSVYFSVGCQLTEDYYFDQETGVQLNKNMIDYKHPGVLDVPPSLKVALETRSGNAAYGASGISHSLSNTHLIMCAIHNATGVWVQPPATPDKVLKALGKI